MAQNLLAKLEQIEARQTHSPRRTGTLRVIVVSPGFCVLTDSKTYRFTRS